MGVKQQLVDANAAIEGLRQQVDAEKTLTERRDEEIQSAKNDMLRVTSELEEEKQRIAQLQQQQQQHELQLAEAQAQVDKETKAAKVSINDTDKLRSELDWKTKELEEARKSVEDAMGVKQQLVDANAENERLRQQVDAEKALTGQLKRRHEEEIQSAKNDMHRVASVLQAEKQSIAQLQQQHKLKLAEAEAEVNKESEAAKVSRDNADKLRRELDGMKENLKTGEESVEALQKQLEVANVEISELKKQVEAKNVDAEKMKESHGEEVRKAQNDIVQLQRQHNDQLKQADQRLETAEKSTIDARTELGGLKDQLVAVNAEGERLKGQVVAGKESAAEANRLKQKLMAAKTEIKRLGEQVETYEQRIHELQTKCKRKRSVDVKTGAGRQAKKNPDKRSTGPANRKLSTQPTVENEASKKEGGAATRKTKYVEHRKRSAKDAGPVARAKADKQAPHTQDTGTRPAKQPSSAHAATVQHRPTLSPRMTTERKALGKGDKSKKRKRGHSDSLPGPSVKSRPQASSSMGAAKGAANATRTLSALPGAAGVSSSQVSGANTAALNESWDVPTRVAYVFATSRWNTMRDVMEEMHKEVLDNRDVASKAKDAERHVTLSDAKQALPQLFAAIAKAPAEGGSAVLRDAFREAVAKWVDYRRRRRQVLTDCAEFNIFVLNAISEKPKVGFAS
uniref:Uncharacterized protein n=1 Tax=Tetraselmis chuii TaxID=63592 RepID=A0A7S1STP2_9CHLO